MFSHLIRRRRLRPRNSTARPRTVPPVRREPEPMPRMRY
jgi:hypothetical protein